MTIRRGKKVRKQRGRRTYGRGCSKRGRGSGERGGTGMSGGHKHKWSYIIRYMPDYFGKHGFTRPDDVRRGLTVINVGEIDENLEKFVKMGVARQAGEKFVVDLNKLGVDRVLGGGRVTHQLEVTAKSFVDSAKRKLEEAGGRAIAG
ncbi:MAG: uL15m family ribosomal protein [Candidatus Hadarchaeum sp.]|uniref:uL15m family ribosomal protein n=1 Tax=Candidatus Hadarchaeum sp. TaxID=2883567 RepID=UPI003D123C1A